MNINILFEDSHIIVCAKPSGIATQTQRIAEPDMVSLLKNHLAYTHKEKAEPYLGIIHRLDQPVAGLLVFAKTSFAAKALSRQLQQNQFHKHYRALLCSPPQSTYGTVTNYLLKLPKDNRSIICSRDTPNAKKALLTYSVIENASESSENYTAVHITLETGRHHQIRLQMAHMGCPILGDTKYNKEPFPDKIKVPLALCAYKLEFHHPKTGKFLSFSI